MLSIIAPIPFKEGRQKGMCDFSVNGNHEEEMLVHLKVAYEMAHL